MSKKYIIIDKDKLTISMLKHYFEIIPGYEFQGSFTDYKDANELVRSRKIDFVFISFSDRSNIIDYINTVNDSFVPLFVVMSEYRDDIHKIKGTINVMDFLEKPIFKDRLELALNIVNYGLEIRSCISTDTRLGKEFIFVKIDKKKIRINIDDILYVESLKDYIKIVTYTKTHLVYSTLTNFTNELPQNSFMRVHRSYTVALDKVDSLEGKTLEINGNKIVFSRKYIDELRERLFIID